MSRKIYVASSWRNFHQQGVVTALRGHGHEVYDFKNPPEGTGFSWGEVDRTWKNWTLNRYLLGLTHPTAQTGFSSDWNAMLWADTCVLVLPCGRSAHIEAGYFVGAQKQLFIWIPPDESFEPELMYLMATEVTTNLERVFEVLKHKEAIHARSFALA